MPDPEDRDPLRRFRGRLPTPVTIVTAGYAGNRTGLTVSSLLVMEGEPGQVLLLVNPNSELWDTIGETKRMVVHICTPDHRGLAEVFAGRQPSPGGVFAGLTVTDGPWGPVLEDLPDRLSISVTSVEPAGWSGLVRGGVDHVDVSSAADPLIYYRGRYRSLA